MDIPLIPYGRIWNNYQLDLMANLILEGASYSYAGWNAEKQCQDVSCYSERNNCRLKAHVTCYASRGFIPFLGLPEGGSDIGWNMLLNYSQCN